MYYVYNDMGKFINDIKSVYDISITDKRCNF